MIDNDVNHIIPVILCGGMGRRLWPLSTPKRPKPYIRDLAGQSFLQKTLARCAGMMPPIIVCNRAHIALVRRDLGHNNPSVSIIAEPCGRNTGPAIVAAAHYVRMHYGDDAVMVVMPCDHAIGDDGAVIRACDALLPLLPRDGVGVFGVAPNGPETRYGYIRATPIHGHNVVYDVAAFVEKPDLACAQSYLADRALGRAQWWWNSGLFLARAGAVIGLAAHHAPDIDHYTHMAVREGVADRHAFILSSAFSLAPARSFDVAIMEYVRGVRMAPLPATWSDLGAWSGLLAGFGRAGVSPMFRRMVVWPGKKAS